MKRSFEKAKKAVERLFWDTCFVETFSEETAAWGESLHTLLCCPQFRCCKMP